MSKLLYFFNVWNNLEENYCEYVKQSRITRKEYLQKLIGLSDSVGGSAVIENYLSDEVEHYTDFEYEQYEKLRALFNDVYDKLKRLGNREVESFDSFMYGYVDAFSLDDYKTFMESKTVDPSELFEAGFVHDVTYYDGKEVKSLKPHNTDKYIAINDVQELQAFLNQTVQQLEGNASESLQAAERANFRKSCYQALKLLAKKNKLSVPIVFIDGELFTTDERGRFIAGKFKHAASDIYLGRVTCSTINGECFEADARYFIFRTGTSDNVITVVGVC